MTGQIKAGDHVFVQKQRYGRVDRGDPPSSDGRTLVYIILDDLPNGDAQPFFLEDIDRAEESPAPAT